jgi:hypothetical protein
VWSVVGVQVMVWGEISIRFDDQLAARTVAVLSVELSLNERLDIASAAARC